MNLEEIWRLREEEIYPALFGAEFRGIFPLDQERFTTTFRQADVDPRWLFHGVFEFAPTSLRPSWLYVTSGYSNPWEAEAEGSDPEPESGSGVEFVFAVSQQGDWAIRVLQNMLAYQLLLEAGRFPGRTGLSLYDRIPLGGSLTGEPDCCLTNLVCVEAEGIPEGFSLPSGEVIFAGFTAIADPELQYAKANGSEALISALRTAHCHPITDPYRKSAF